MLCPVGKDGKGPGAWPRGSVVLCGVSAAGSPPGAATSACGSLLLFLLLCPPAQRSGFAGFGSQPSVDYQAVRVHAGEVTFLSEPSYACCFLKSQLGFPTSSPSDSFVFLLIAPAPLRPRVVTPAFSSLLS